MSGLMDPLAMSPRGGAGSPSPFPKSPADWALRTIDRDADYVGPFGAWDGDGNESAEEVAAARISQTQPSVMGHVLAGEKIQVRPRCEDCGSVMLRDGHGASWCPSCISAGIQDSSGQFQEDEAEAEPDPEPVLDGRGLAALPVTLSDRVLAAHEELVLKTHGPELKDEFDIQLGFNPNTGAFDAMMRGDVMQVLHDMGPVITIKGRIHF